MQTIARLVAPPVVIVTLFVAAACQNNKLRPANPPPDTTRPRDAGLGLDGPATDARPPGETCAEEVHKTGLVPVDVLLLLDRGYSTDYVVEGSTLTRWVIAREAMMNFLRSPGAEGLNVGLQFFPWAADNPICAQDSDCPGTTRVVPCLYERMCTGPLTIGCGMIAGATSPNDCPAGQRCKMGQCNVTGHDCFELDKACDSGVAGDMCKPRPRTCRGSSVFCDYEKYDQPNLGFGTLPAHTPALVQRLLYTNPTGLQYTGPAVDGSLKLLRRRMLEMPGRKGVLVIITDVEPTINCLPPSLPLIADLIGEYYNDTPSIPTYVLGVVADKDLPKIKPQLDGMAAKGGTKAATVIKPSAADLLPKFQAALDEIRGLSLPCELTIPNMTSGPIDYAKVNLTLKGAGGETRVPYVGRAEACDATRGGWYYDIDPSAPADAGAPPPVSDATADASDAGDAREAGDGSDAGDARDIGSWPPRPTRPTRVVTCEATCKAFKSDSKAEVQIRYGCKTQGIE